MIFNNLKSSNLIIELFHPMTNKGKILGLETKFLSYDICLTHLCCYLYLDFAHRF